MTDADDPEAQDAPRVSETTLRQPVAEVDPDWETLIKAAVASPVPVTYAQTYHRGPWQSASRPVCVKCSDGIYRVIKGKQAGGRMLFNDQVVARLGQRLGAPIPVPSIVELPKALIDAEPNLNHMTPGLCHGLEFLDEHTDRLGIAHADLSANRPRFATLSILYGWAHASDHQQIYPNAPPHIVWSVDHGHFLGNGGPEWTAEMLATRGPAHADQVLSAGAALTSVELIAGAETLGRVTPDQVAGAIGAPPDEWQISLEDRVALAKYLWKRRGELIAVHAAPAAVAEKIEAAGA